MKLYYSILTVLACYGCTSQQPKDTTPYPPQDTSTKVDTRQIVTPDQSVSKVTQVSPPQTNLKTSTETKTKAKKDKVIKSSPSKSNKTAIKPEPSVKSDSRQLSSSNPTGSKVSQSNTTKTSSKTNTKKHKIKTTPKTTKDIAIELKKRVESDSSQLSSNNTANAKVTPINTPETDLKTSTETQEIKATSIKSNNVVPMDSAKDEPEQTSSSSPSESVVATIITPQTNLETDAESQVIEDTQMKSSTIDFDLEKLPLNFGDTWSLDRNHDKISKTTRCLLNSQKKNFHDGYTDSSISLQLSSDTLLIKTNSAIDLTYPDIGIYIDQNAPFPLEKIFGESSVLIKDNAQKIISQLVDGEKLTIKLGFWPTWPQTGTHSIDFALADFDNAYQYFQACEQL